MTFPFVSFDSFDLEFVFDVPAASSVSSNVVALVEYDPSAEELLLCEGEASIKSACETDLASPLTLNNEWVLELLWLAVPILGLEPRFDFTLPDE